MYLQSLLRDGLVTIRIDHQYLLSIKEASDLMIVRWYMAFSVFSFNLSFIRNVDNNIADAMSLAFVEIILTLLKNIRILESSK